MPRQLRADVNAMLIRCTYHHVRELVSPPSRLTLTLLHNLSASRHAFVSRAALSPQVADVELFLTGT